MPLFVWLAAVGPPTRQSCSGTTPMGFASLTLASLVMGSAPEHDCRSGLPPYARVPFGLEPCPAVLDPSGGLELGSCVGGGWGGILLRGGFSQLGVRKMALIKSSLLATISGSIGGTTYARNRGGAYARNRSLPIQPRSANQERARSQLSFFSVYWTDTLTNAQRDAWNQYAASLVAQNRIGDSIVRTGQQAFVQSNTLAQLANLAIIADAPPSNVQFAIAANPQVVVHDVSDNTVTVILSAPVTGTVLAFCSPPVSNGSAATSQDFRFFGRVAATALTTVPVVGTNVGRRVFVANNNQIWRFRAIASDGSFSNQLILRGLSQA